MVWRSSVGTRIVTHRGPTSTQRHAFTVINQPTTHSHFGRAVKLVGSLRIANPALVIYMAAQAFVRRSYAEPFEDVGFGIGSSTECELR